MRQAVAAIGIAFLAIVGTVGVISDVQADTLADAANIEQQITTTADINPAIVEYLTPAAFPVVNAVDVTCPDGQVVTSGHLTPAEALFLCGLASASR